MVVHRAREKLLQEGRPAFIIADHYGMAGEFSFYLPEAKAALPGLPLVYSQRSSVPNNQLCFWPEYCYELHRSGENAVYVAETGPFPLENGWLWRWLRRKPVRYARVPPPVVPPALLLNQFESVTDLGAYEVKLGDRVFRRLQLFECRNLH